MRTFQDLDERLKQETQEIRFHLEQFRQIFPKVYTGLITSEDIALLETHIRTIQAGNEKFKRDLEEYEQYKEHHNGD